VLRHWFGADVSVLRSPYCAVSVVRACLSTGLPAFSVRHSTEFSSAFAEAVLVIRERESSGSISACS